MPADPRRLLPLAAAGLVLLAVLGPVGCSSEAPPPSRPTPPDVAEAVDPDPPPPDPRLTFDTPYRNVKPGVKYLGDAACAACHADIDKSFHQHPMGRSAERLTAGGGAIEKFDAAAHASFTAGGFDLSVERTPAGLVHRVKAKDGSPPGEWSPVVQVAIGSGTRGRSYLTVEDGGAVWQTPLSWWGPEQRWDLSPGFRLGTAARRPVVPECLFCHVNHVEPVPGAENRFREPVFAGPAAIGCERCHGPGELHAAERAGGAAPGGPDTSIVNPKHLPPALKSAVCEQCHLQGERRVIRRGRELWEFRPGLPMELFQSVFVRHPDIADRHKSVGQFEQMEKSKCFTTSGGKLGCTSCHDPHGLPAAEAKVAFYRSKCLSCHEQKGCTAPAPDRQAKADSCVACHMPRAGSQNVVHASVTDHRVPRVPVPAPAPKLLPFGTPPLVRFRSTPYTPPAAELDRDLGIGLSVYAGFDGDPETQAGLRRMATERLTASLRRWPGDADAWSALAGARGGTRTAAAERLKAAATAAKLAPQSDRAVAGLVTAATEAGRFDLAEEAATRMIALAPRSHDPRLARSFARMRLKEWAGAAEDAREAARLHPLHPEARLYLAIATHHLGDPEGARKLALTAAGLEGDPGQRAGLLSWFREHTR